MNDDSDWFVPKRLGYGPGVPIRWQGWALTIGYAAVAVAVIFAFKGRPLQLIPSLVLPTVAFLVVGCRKTRGGCRWRKGEGE